jgi:ATPases of the AAA+ class
MHDFLTAFKAHLPFIAVRTDDPVNVRTVLQHWSGKTLQPLPTAKAAPVGDQYLWWTEDPQQITTDMYRKLCGATASAVVINPDKPSLLVYDTGILQTPPEFYRQYLQEFVTPEEIEPLVQQLKGLSLKSAQEVVQLTMARSNSIVPHEVRKTRQMMGGETSGLSQLDTEYDFYQWPHALQEWLALNDSYFLDLNTPPQLVPRGLLLDGEPGVGKSMAAKVLAKHWDVPLFRLDVSTALNRYLGESESRIARNLQVIEQNAPCVWLLDECEKLFATNGDEGTTQRILSQILWWLQAHTSRVLTVMTTNNLATIPKELYRAERLDKVLHLEKLSLSSAKAFATQVYESVLKTPLLPKRAKVIRDLLDKGDKGTYSHAEVRVLVYECIKQQNWLKDPA